LQPTNTFWFSSKLIVLASLGLERYVTIRDAILTFARKPTRVSLIYRTETTTKIVKQKTDDDSYKTSRLEQD